MAEDKERERQRKELKERWDTFNQNADKMAQSMRSIDDHAIENLPTFIFRRYQNNEFGDLSTEEGKKDAKLRMAYFMINGIGTALQNASASIKGGAMQQSDYEKYKESNLANALENRWSKYKQEMNNAMDLAKQRGMSEEALTDSIATISSNNRLQSAANMMNEEQKVFAFEVLAEIGGNLGNMNNPDFVNTLMGMSAMNQDLDPKEAAAMLVYRFGKDPDKVKDFISGLGFDLDGIKKTVGSGETKTSSIAGNGNLKGYQTIDGDTVDFEFMFTKGNGGKERLQKLAQDLSEKYYKGEIDEATFRKYFTPLYEEGKKHTSVKVFSPDSVINDNNTRRLNELNSSYDELNRQAKNGEISVKDYNEQYADLIANANKWGASKKYLDALNKNKIADNKIEAAINKKSKKK
jgi:hypothetical protein